MSAAPLVTATASLQDARQTLSTAELQAMPPYMQSFLARLRLLINLPFSYLIPDPRLLPDESIRFFYLDRSWADRMVDGAIAVGMLGTREQAHYVAHVSSVRYTLDHSEPAVRAMQAGSSLSAALTATAGVLPDGAPDTTLAGFILRSSLVSGWPHMAVSAVDANDRSLPILRLDLLSPGMMFAIFMGVPQSVTFQEPPHGVQFGLGPVSQGKVTVTPTKAWPNAPAPPSASVSLRDGTLRTVDVAALASQVAVAPGQSAPTGSSTAYQLVRLPWTQVLSGASDYAKCVTGRGNSTPLAAALKTSTSVAGVGASLVTSTFVEAASEPVGGLGPGFDAGS